jgi:hypothetical protein
MVVCHKCDVRSCVNPDHLFLGTSQDNYADAAAKGRNTRGTKHGCARLTEEQVIAIRASSETQVDIARRYGVRQAHVSRILLRQSWKHI